ncbi:MAG: winged helix-turn-helix transcriptional regulator [Candidatus Lokiarchaeota archaeon]|nr:winged helix-turn-helix transcriptional regulator [Candidatus Harpocratesius repetitus]
MVCLRSHSITLVLILISIYIFYLLFPSIFFNEIDQTLPSLPSDDIRNSEFENFLPNLSVKSIFFIVSLLIIALSTIFSADEAVNWLENRINENKGIHRLSCKDILSNENRQRLLSTIANEPGIHFNALKRQLNLSAGQMTWHLEILEQYGLIKKAYEGQFCLFFLRDQIPKNLNIMIKIDKSVMTRTILNLIDEKPGITASEIAQKTGLRRNSVKYHVDKLQQLQKIKITKDGRQKRLFLYKEIYQLTD